MAGLTIRELVTKLGFDIEDEKLDKFESRVDHVKKGLLALTVAGGAAAAGLFAIAKSAANVGDNLDSQADVLGFAVEKLQIWTRAAALGDIASEEFGSSVQFLNRNIGDAIRGQGTAGKTFRELGIQIKGANGQARSTSDVLDDLSKRFQTIDDPAKRASIAMDLFGRGGVRMGRFLAQSSEDIKRATEVVQAFGFYTAETAALADQTNDTLEDSETLVRGIKNEIGIGLLPVMKHLAERFNAWTLANKEMIKTRIDRFVNFVSRAIRGAFEIGERFGKFMAGLVRILGGVDAVLKMVGAALLGLGGAAVIGSVVSLIGILGALGVSIGVVLLEVVGIPLLIAAAIAFIALAIEDLYVWIKGGDSVLGHWLGNWKDFAAKVKDEFAFLVEGLGVIWLGLKDLFGGLWDTLAGAWGILTSLWMGDTEKFIASFKQMFLGLATFLLKAPLEIVAGLMQTAGAAVALVLKNAFKILSEIVQAAIPPGLVKLLTAAGSLAVKGGGMVASAFSGPSAGSYIPNVTTSSPYSLLRPPSAPTSVSVQANTPINVTLPAGTPKEHADEMTRIFEENMDKSIRHSLQMSTRAGG
jgi:hypothetical protein